MNYCKISFCSHQQLKLLHKEMTSRYGEDYDNDEEAVVLTWGYFHSPLSSAYHNNTAKFSFSSVLGQDLTEINTPLYSCELSCLAFE